MQEENRIFITPDMVASIGSIATAAGSIGAGREMQTVSGSAESGAESR
ncbi:MAG: hypothetical protein ACOX5C_05880 [Acutalibacteraceae bacterium]